MRISAAVFSYGFGDFESQFDGEIIGDPNHGTFFVISTSSWTFAFAIWDVFRSQRSAMWNTNNNFYISSEVL